MHTMWSRRRRLEQRAQEILNKDRVLGREGVTSLSLEDLRTVCINWQNILDNLVANCISIKFAGLLFAWT